MMNLFTMASEPVPSGFDFDEKMETDVLGSFKRFEGLERLVFNQFFSCQVKKKYDYCCVLMHRFLCINNWGIVFFSLVISIYQ